MDVAIQRPMTVAEFLLWEERQELRHEFDGERPAAMNGGTIGHEAISGRLRFILQLRLDGAPLGCYGPSLKIEVAGRVRYPDALVARTRVDLDGTIMPEPLAVFEVVSPSSSRTDRIAKLREYQSTPSIRHYLILEQDCVAATLFTRAGPIWDAVGLLRGDLVRLGAIGVEFPLADAYANLDLPDPYVGSTDA